MKRLASLLFALASLLNRAGFWCLRRYAVSRAPVVSWNGPPPSAEKLKALQLEIAASMERTLA